MLTLEQVSKTFTGPGGEVRAVDGIDLRVAAGEFVVVRGPSGCGKSTLLLAAGGLQEPDAGRVTVDEDDLYAMSANARAVFRARHIGFVFQQFHLIPYLSVRDNILAAALATGVTREVRERADELIERFGLGHRVHHVPAASSTGERQRTALARALLNQPRLILADEPTGNLDTDNARVVLEFLRDFAKDGGAVLLVTHDVAAAEFADRSVEIVDGVIVS